MFFWNKFCGLFLLFFIFINFSYAQSAKRTMPGATNKSLNISSFIFDTSPNPGSIISFINSADVKNTYLFSKKNAAQEVKNFNAPFASVIPGNFSTCNFGFFCRQELKIEKATNLPIRIRLGSLEQCNYYERKP